MAYEAYVIQLEHQIEDIRNDVNTLDKLIPGVQEKEIEEKKALILNDVGLVKERIMKLQEQKKKGSSENVVSRAEFIHFLSQCMNDVNRMEEITRNKQEREEDARERTRREEEERKKAIEEMEKKSMKIAERQEKLKIERQTKKKKNRELEEKLFGDILSLQAKNNEILRKLIREADETIEIGSSIKDTLDKQMADIRNIAEMNQNLKYNTERLSGELKNFLAEAKKQKLIFASIACVIILAIIGVCFIISIPIMLRMIVVKDNSPEINATSNITNNNTTWYI